MTSVAVLGAGISGLACARTLCDEGVDVVVLEARDRVGGRVWTARDLGPEPVELGAIFVHGEHASILNVVREAGLHLGGGPGGPRRAVVIDGDEVVAAERYFAEVGGDGFWSVESAVAKLGARDAPLRTELIRAGWSGLRLRLAFELFEQIWVADPDLLSAEGVTRVENSWTSGHDDRTIAEGYDRVAEHLARDMDVRLGHVVRDIAWRRGGATIQTSEGSFGAEHVVITVPPSVIASDAIDFTPSLPDGKRRAAASIPLGSVMRVCVRLKEPAPSGVWAFVLGGGWWSVTEGSQLLVAWIGGPSAAARSGWPIHELLRPLAGALPWLDTGMIAEARIADWGADPFARGAYSYPRAGALDAPYRWAEPVDDVLFFAGEGTCGDVHPATVHGAYDSGVRAAREIVER